MKKDEIIEKINIFNPMQPREYSQDKIVISPSQASKFNDNIFECITNLVLKKITFKGNTATLLGNCIHRVAEIYYVLKDKKQTREYALEEIHTYIRNLIVPDDIEINKELILEQFPSMMDTMLKYFAEYGLPDESEVTLSMDLNDNILLRGTYDARQGSTLIDYKTTSVKNPQAKIPQHYRLQMLLYAYMLKQQGRTISNLRLVWITQQDINRISEKTGKPMKDYPSQFIVINERVTDEDLIEIEEFLQSMKNTLYLLNENKALVHAFGNHFELKQKMNNKEDEKQNAELTKKDNIKQLTDELFE